MDIKSVFLNGYLEEEFYVEQPPDFENEKLSNHVYRLIKALYGLKQVPRAWYERLTFYLSENSFKKSQVDTTLFTRTNNCGDLLIVQIYVDGIIFCSSNTLLYDEFAFIMQKEFEMSIMGELIFFWDSKLNKCMKVLLFINENTLENFLKDFAWMNVNL